MPIFAAIGAAFAGISSIATSIAGGIGTLGTLLGTKLIPALKTLMTTINTWAPIIEAMVKIFQPNFMPKEQKVDELGSRVLQADFDEKDFDSFDAYMQGE